MEIKRPETPRNKESNPRLWWDAQQRVNQVIVLTNLSARSGLIEIETIYKIAKIKVSNYLMRSEDPRLQLVRRCEEMKVAKGLK